MQDFRELASSWHTGQSSMMYAYASVGDLIMGRSRPFRDDFEPMSDQEWLECLWEGLIIEIQSAIKSEESKEGTKESDPGTDLTGLQEFEAYAQARLNYIRMRPGHYTADHMPRLGDWHVYQLYKKDSCFHRKWYAARELMDPSDGKVRVHYLYLGSIPGLPHPGDLYSGYYNTEAEAHAAIALANQCKEEKCTQ